MVGGSAVNRLKRRKVYHLITDLTFSVALVFMFGYEFGPGVLLMWEACTMPKLG